MISDNDKKKLEDIKNGLKSIEANLDNLGFIYKIASNLFRLSNCLEDDNLKSNIKAEVTKITQTQYREEIQQAVKSIFTLVSEAENIKKEQKYFQGATPRKTEEYEKDCEKYNNLRDNIKDVENKILNSPSYQEKLHAPLKQSKIWPRHLHARLTDNLRIIYFYDKKTKEITFKRIITHNELDKS